MEQIPILIHGMECGTVRFRREGAYMVCGGQAQYEGDMVRLWIYGKGEPGYLGVLMPDGKGNGIVRKKFSLSDFAQLPNPMEYCATEAVVSASVQEATVEADILWHAVGDGTLVRFAEGRRYMAFPAEEIRLPRGARFVLRMIEGKQYVIFPY